MKKITTFVLIYMALLSFPALAQTQESDDSSLTNTTDSWTKVDLQRTINLENDSKSMDVIINVKENVQRFEFNIYSYVTIGKLTIEVYDPNGIKRGNFAVGTQSNSEIEESANGNIQKSLFEPQSGDWKVKIIPREATGKIIIRTTIREYSTHED